MSALLALFARSLRDLVRAKSHFWMRAGVAVLVLFFLAVSHQTSQWMGAPGRTVFAFITAINFLLVTLLAVGYFGTAIAEEKEEQTLGLMRMTNLDPLSILLGKSTSRLFAALMLLAVQVPFAILAVTLGGVSLGQIEAAYTHLGAYTFMLCNLALLASVVFSRVWKAALATLVVLFVFFVGPEVLRKIALSAALMPVDYLYSAADAWESILPTKYLETVFTTGFAGDPFGWPILSHLLGGAGCFLLAWLVFERFADPAGTDRSSSGILQKLTWLRRMPGRPWPRPLAWKDFHFHGGGRPALLARIAICALAPIAVWGLNDDVDEWDSLWPKTAGVAWQIIKIELAIIAALVFHVERRHGTFSSLAMLPTPLGQVVRDKLRGLAMMLLPAICLLVLSLALGAGPIAEALRQMIRGRDDAGNFTVMFGYGLGFSGAVTQSADLVFFLYLIAWLSLRLKWAALPAALGISIVADAFASISIIFWSALPFGITSGEFFMPAFNLFFAAIYAVLAIVLHRLTRRRLTALAAEEGSAVT